MARGKKFNPTEKQLHHAWQLKMNGFTDAEIAAKLGISSVSYSLHRLKFLIYFAQKRREAEQVATRGRPRGSNKLETYRFAAVKLAELGENVEKIAKHLGLPDSTLRSWLKEDLTFAHEIETAKDRYDHDVIKALYRRAVGFTTREATRTDMRIGTAIAQSTTTRRVMRVLPSVKAIELWLTNRRKWLSENQSDKNPNEDLRPIEYIIRQGLYNKGGADGKENVH
jgi:hypothetical protein